MAIIHLSNALTISQDTYINQDLKCCIGKWSYKGNQIAIYSQSNKIWAVVKDVFGKIMILPNDHIKAGINGNITKDNLLKMIKCDHDKIATTLIYNRDNKLTLWIIPKLEAAGIQDDLLIRQAKKCESDAQTNADKWNNNHNENDFKEACKKYQEALDHYQKAYNVRSKNKEDTQDVETAISVLRKDFFLFQLDQTMLSCLPLRKDRDEVKNIFKPFEEEQDIFKSVIESDSINKNEEQRLRSENFACAYSYEFLEDYISAAKSYLLLSKQQHEYGNSKSSAFCITRAKDLFTKLEQISKEQSLETVLGNIGIEWIRQTISNIPGNDYFEILLEENRLKTLACRFKEKAQKEAQEYNYKEAKEYNTNKDEKEKKFIAVCESYKDAINHMNEAYNYIKNSKRNTQDVEKTIQALQKEYFEFMLDPLMKLYLPSNNDQISFCADISSLTNKKDFFINKEASIDKLLKAMEQMPEEKRSLVDHFKCAYVCEFLEDPISASQHYFLLCKKYLHYEKPELSVRCLEKADILIRKEAKKNYDPIPIANFLEKLDLDLLNNLYNQAYNDNSCKSYKSYLSKLRIEKEEIRKAFENSLYELKNLSDGEEPRCFICFDIDEEDVERWLSNTLIPDLKRIGVEIIFAPDKLKIGSNLRNFQGQICETEFVIIACTPNLREKCIKQMRSPDGPNQEIKLAIERFKDLEKYETTYLIYLKGDHQSSCPSVFFEPFVGKKLNISGKNTDFDYYLHSLTFFASMRNVEEEKLRQIKNDFKSKVNDILTDKGSARDIQKPIIDAKKCNETKLENLLFDKLKEFYCSQARIETLIDGRTISIEDIYVRLALIKEQKGKKYKENKDGKIQQYPEDGRWPTSETIYDPKESIKLEELFKHEKLEQKKEKRVIVWGVAGEGKSICLHHIAHEWASGRLWNEFKAVFWICLRNLNADYYPPLRREEEDYDACYLIAKECRLLSKEHNLDLSTLRFLLVNKAFCNNTLLVLDGYDELPYIADRGHLANAFKQLKEIFPHILISSRPQSVTFIQNPVEIEILGFDRKGVDQYIEKFHDQISKTSELSSEKLQSKLKGLRYLLKQKPLINSLSCIPINLELLCCLYFFEEEIDANAFKTIISLYSHIIDWLCKRFLLRPGISDVSSADICELENICDHSKISPLISILTEVAWYAMGENTFYFPQNKIKADLFNSIRALGLLKIKNRMANFIHSTFQEYFAAVYLAIYYIQGKSKEAKKNIAKNKLIPRYKLVFEMTAGYLSSLNEKKLCKSFSMIYFQNLMILQ